MKRTMKKHKWYSTKYKPDKYTNLIIQTDMGYIFEAVYEDNQFKISYVENNKVYFRDFPQDSILKWMKI